MVWYIIDKDTQITYIIFKKDYIDDDTQYITLDEKNGNIKMIPLKDLKTSNKYTQNIWKSKYKYLKIENMFFYLSRIQAYQGMIQLEFLGNDGKLTFSDTGNGMFRIYDDKLDDITYKF